MRGKDHQKVLLPAIPATLHHHHTAAFQYTIDIAISPHYGRSTGRDIPTLVHPSMYRVASDYDTREESVRNIQRRLKQSLGRNASVSCIDSPLQAVLT